MSVILLSINDVNVHHPVSFLCTKAAVTYLNWLWRRPALSPLVSTRFVGACTRASIEQTSERTIRNQGRLVILSSSYRQRCDFSFVLWSSSLDKFNNLENFSTTTTMNEVSLSLIPIVTAVAISSLLVGRLEKRILLNREGPPLNSFRRLLTLLRA